MTQNKSVPQLLVKTDIEYISLVFSFESKKKKKSSLPADDHPPNPPVETELRISSRTLSRHL